MHVLLKGICEARPGVAVERLPMHVTRSLALMCAGALWPMHAWISRDVRLITFS